MCHPRVFPFACVVLAVGLSVVAGCDDAEPGLVYASAPHSPTTALPIESGMIEPATQSSTLNSINVNMRVEQLSRSTQSPKVLKGVAQRGSALEASSAKRPYAFGQAYKSHKASAVHPQPGAQNTKTLSSPSVLFNSTHMYGPFNTTLSPASSTPGTLGNP